MSRNRLFFTSCFFAFVATVLPISPADAAGRFIDSSDYRDDDEIVGKMLVDDDYRKLVEDLEYRNISFDWGWVKATGKKANKPKELGFAVSSYKTIYIAPVTNPSLELVSGLTDDVRDLFAASLSQIGLELSTSRKNADLELELAVVDYNPESIYIYFAWIDPFIELEMRLRDVATGEDLLLVRDQDHGSTPLHGAADIATNLAKFLR